MKLRKIEFQGIRAFADKTVFRFGTEPGLYFLQGGENLQDPDLGSNGVGKSTIWAILCWVLFGKTPDGLRAGDIKSWQAEEKGYYAKLWLDRNVIRRSWKPNQLTFNNEVVTQEQLEDLIGTNFETFLSAVLLAQGKDVFFDFLPAKKLSMFTSLLGLENWIDYSGKAKFLSNKLAKAIHDIEVIVSRLAGKIDGIDVQGIEEKSKSFRAMRQKKIGKTQASYNEFTDDFERISELVEQSESRQGKLAKKNEKIGEEKDGCRERFNAILEKISRQKRILERLNYSKESIKEKLEYLHSHKDKECVSCLQHISLVMATKQIKQLEETKRFLMLEIKPIEQRIEKLLSRKEKASEKVDSCIKKLKIIRRKMQEAGEVHAKLLHDYSKVAAAKKIAESAYEEALSGKDPYKKMLVRKRELEAKLILKLEKNNAKSKKLEAERAIAEYWIQGFKDIRLKLIKEALFQLEIQTNDVLSQLGLAEQWAVRYSIEKAIKRGGSVSGFTVSIENPITDRIVPFAAWSGGEKQRLRIAGSIGFMSLVADRSGIDFGIEVYDEPTQHLSPEGIDGLLEALRQRAIQTGRRIWLVDHHTLDYGDFSDHIVVSKNADGRSFLCVGN